jgi:hypothetical protein
MTIRKTWEGLGAGEVDGVGLVATRLGVGLVLAGAGTAALGAQAARRHADMTSAIDRIL